MRLSIIIILVICIGLIAFQDIKFYKDYHVVRVEYASVLKKLEDLKKENKKIEEDLLYFKSNENIEKEARSMLNYKKPGEKVMVIVPKDEQY